MRYFLLGLNLDSTVVYIYKQHLTESITSFRENVCLFVTVHVFIINIAIRNSCRLSGIIYNNINCGEVVLKNTYVHISTQNNYQTKKGRSSVFLSSTLYMLLYSVFGDCWDKLCSLKWHTYSLFPTIKTALIVWSGFWHIRKKDNNCECSTCMKN